MIHEREVYYNGIVPIEFYRRAAGSPGRLAILPGAFNPPTKAHLALARAGLDYADEVLIVLPRTFPHKEYEGATFDDRIEMLLACTTGDSRYSVGSVSGGLYIDVAREARTAYGPATKLSALCGRDAAERIVNWDYGHPAAFEKMLEEFDLLVASRGGSYEPPLHFGERIRTIAIAPDCEEISATEVRERLRRGDPWRHLVPEAIVRRVAELYA